MCGLRKDNRHVEFPFSLNIAPFCASTSQSNANVDAGTQEIGYDLFGVVEHSGRLQVSTLGYFTGLQRWSIAKYKLNGVFFKL